MKITKKLITHKFAFDLRQQYHHRSCPLALRQPCNPIMSTIMDSNGQSIKVAVVYVAVPDDDSFP